MGSEFDPYHQWLGIRFPERPPNHYRLLGIDLYEKDCDVISHAADRQMAHLRTFQNARQAELSQQLLNEVAAARVCLLDAQRKADYDRQLRLTNPPEAPPTGGSPVAAVTKSASIVSEIHVDSADDYRLGRPGRGRGRRRTLLVIAGVALLGLLTVGGYLALTEPGKQLYRSYLAQEPNQADERETKPDGDPQDREGTEVGQPDESVAGDAEGQVSPPDALEGTPTAEDAGSPMIESASQTTTTAAPSDDTSQQAPASPPADGLLAPPMPADLHAPNAPWDLAPRLKGPRLKFSPADPVGSYLLLASKRDLSSANAMLQSIARGDYQVDQTIVDATEMAHFLLDRFWAAVDESLQGLSAGQVLTFELATVTVVSKDDRSLELEAANGQRKSYALQASQMDPHLAMALVERQFSQSRAAAWRMIGVFLAVDHAGDADLAADYLTRANQQGFTTDLLSSVLLPDGSAPSRSVATTEGAARRSQPPSDEAYKSARRLMLTRLRDNPSVSLDAPDLPQRLFDHAATVKSDLVARYVLLREALTRASAMANVDLALQAVDELASAYEVDDWKLREAVIESVMRRIDVGGRKVFADRVLLLSKQAVAEDRFDQATRLADQTIAIARSLGDTDYLKRLQAHRDEMRQLIGLQRSYQAAVKVLEQTPDDAMAHQQVGEFLCFAKGDFQQGIVHLVKSQDTRLRQLAARETTPPSSAADMILLADDWQDLAAKKNGLEKRRILERARLWYEQALPSASREEAESVQRKLDQIVSVIGRDQASLKLTELKPVQAKVGYGTFGINQNPNLSNPRVNRLPEINGEVITDYLWAHAPSQVEYVLPSGANAFSAIGALNAASQDGVRFLVIADGKPIFGSPVITQMGQAFPIRVSLPRGTRTLILMVDKVGNYSNDQAYWVSPLVTF